MRGYSRETDAGDRRPGHSPSGVVVLEKKLQPAPIRSDWVERRVLCDQLVDAADKRLVLVCAPIGYGKTILLTQWRADPREARPFAWVAIDTSDNELVRFWTYLIEAIRRVEPGFGSNVTQLLDRPDPPSPGTLVPQLLEELAVLPRRIVIVLDDFFQLTDRACHESIAEIVEHLPSTAQLVISTRTDPLLPPLDRIRLMDEILELRAAHLRFSLEETRVMLGRTTHIDISQDDVRYLVERTEGWPAGLYLAALSLQGRADVQTFIRDFAGDSRHVVDYLTPEVLNHLPERVRRFLVRTSVLETFTSSLCNAVVGEETTEILEELDRSNLFLIPVEGRENWFRYHHLFRELLRSELETRNRALVPELHRRASQWHRKQGFLDGAIRHAIAADDIESSRELISRNWLAYCKAGQVETVRSWIASLGNKRVASDPVLSLTAAWTEGLSGHRDEAERWVELASRGTFDGPLPDGTSSLDSGIALARASFGHEGVTAALAAARVAVELESRAETRWHLPAMSALGFYLYLSGQKELATAQLNEVVRHRTADSTHEVIFALAQLSVMAAEEGRRTEAARLAREAVEIVDEHLLSESPHSSIAHTALGLALAAANDVRGARRELEMALELRNNSARIAPWPRLQLMLALAPIRAIQGDREGAAILLRDARALVDAYPDAGILGARLEELERSIGSTKQRPAPLAESLTHRELSVLRLLPTSLTQRQIGDELFLSINTVKTHVRSIFGKLGVESRQEAVSEARELGLL
jgi:LuxR family transcriptional regulator, maltose regulon positive regulatory protein